jgi:rod shape-determining protein MreB
VGGDEFNNDIITFLQRSYNLISGALTAEAVKLQVGSVYRMDEEREMQVKGRDLVSGIPKTISVHSQEIRECFERRVWDIVEAVRRSLETVPPEMAGDMMDQGIVLTGGGAMLRGLDLLIARETSLPVHVTADPLKSVVRGLGCILSDMQKYKNLLRT